MDQKENKRFDKLYQRHLQMLKLRCKNEETRVLSPGSMGSMGRSCVNALLT